MDNLLDRFQIRTATRRRQRALLNEQRRLAAELADYSTPAQRDDLMATLERYPNEVADPIRRLLPTR